MARYRGSVTKLSRNEGVGLDGFPKCAVLKRPYGSGQHGQARKKLSEYALQLREKQKVKRTYGLLEKQFRRNYAISIRKKGVTGTIMLQRLEARLDSILYRSTLANSRPQSRQLIAHGHILINGKKTDIPSYILKAGDVITVRERSKAFFKSLQPLRRAVADIPVWLNVDTEALTVTVNALPEREEIDRTFKEALIIEFYSR